MHYQIIRSDRKTLALEVKAEGLIVRAPLHMPQAEIEKIISQKKTWIEKSRARMKETEKELKNIEPLTFEEINALADKALIYIPQRVAYYAPLVGVKYGRITVRNQKSRWGSCSNQGNLNFNCLLMLTPPEVIDSVVVHELCHRKEMNHSDRFYEEVLRVFPNYYACNQWLKENGAMLMQRLGR